MCNGIKNLKTIWNLNLSCSDEGSMLNCGGGHWEIKAPDDRCGTLSGAALNAHLDYESDNEEPGFWEK